MESAHKDKMFKCDNCNFESASQKGLKIHKSWKHEEQFCLEEITNVKNETLEHRVDVTFVSDSIQDAKDEVLEYYLKDLNDKENDIKYDKNWIGDAYEGD